MKVQPDWRWLLLLLLAVLAGLYCYLIRPDVVGLLYDDGLYVMTAKALANGHGYRLMEIEGQPYFYKYPPLFPACLAVLWLINPHFPGNILWMKAFNCLLFLGSLALLAYHFRRNLKLSPWICLGLVACLGLNWRFIELSIELMTEPLFMLLSTVALVLAYRYNERWQESGNSPKWQQLLWLIALSVAAFYTRSMGLVLILALGLWLWLKVQRKTALIYTAISGLLLTPWFAWSATKPDTTYKIGDFLVRSFQETYFQSFKMDLRYEFSLPELYGKGLQELLGNFSVQFFPLLEWFFRNKGTLFSEGLILCLSFGLLLFLGAWAYKLTKVGKISPVGIYLITYMLILPSWSYFKIYPRFMVVILPFLLAGFIQALSAQTWPTRWKQAAQGAFLACILLTNLIHLWPYLQKPVPNTLVINPYHDLWRDYQEVFNFFSHKAPPNAIIYNDNTEENYFYALNTKTRIPDFFLFYPKALLDQHCGEQDFACIHQYLQQHAKVLYTLLQRKNVQYVIFERFSIIRYPPNNWRLKDKTLPPVELLLQQHAKELIPVMSTTDGWITVFQFNPKPS